MTIGEPNQRGVGEAFIPEKCVTALFTSEQPAALAVAKLRAAGFTDGQIQVFVGEPGAKRLDADGDKLSGLTKALHALTQALADDSAYLDQAQAALKQGGSLVSVDTGDDEKPVRQAAGALKASGGTDVQHWGQWKTEQF